MSTKALSQIATQNKLSDMHYALGLAQRCDCVYSAKGALRSDFG